MPAVVPRRVPGRLGGLNKKPGQFKPIPRPTQKRPECCDSPQYEIHDGTKICLNCGTQVDENNIVAEVTFGETATGAATVQGGFVGETARHARTLGAAASRRIGGQYQSREETEQNGRSELRQLCPQLRIPTNVEEIAFNLWKLAAAQNFIQGRRTSEVAGVCLYAACRRDKSNTVLLMDISEALQVNVFKLGDIFKELNKALYLEVHTHITPIVEVEPLLMKYASKLEFGEDTRQIVEDAARIIKRMKRDWMVTGRHPAGLCGACLILAARMNNHRRSVREVVYIVKVADMTIATRIQEFKRTKSSAMTVSDFRDKGHMLKSHGEPPSLRAAEERQKQLEAKKRKRDAREEARRTVDISDDGSVATSRQSSTAPSATPEPPTQQQAQDVPATKRRKTTEDKATPQLRRDADGFAIPEIPLDPALRAPRSGSADTEGSRSRASVSATPDPEALEGAKKKRGRPKGGSKKPTITLTDADFAAENELQDDIENILQSEQCVSARNDTEREKLESRASQLAKAERSNRSLAESQRLAKEGRTVQTISDSVEIGEDEFDDDPEVANALLTDEQVRVKEMIWVAHNEDWLRAQQAKHLKRALDEAEGRGPDQKTVKRRKRSRMGDGTVLTEGGTPVASPADAATRMLEKRAPKNWSKSVDYAALNRILGGGEQATPSESQASSPAASSPAQSRASSVAPSEAGGPRPQRDLPTPPDTQHAVVQGIAEAVDAAEDRAERVAAVEQQAQAGAESGAKAGVDGAEDEADDEEEEIEEEEDEPEPDYDEGEDDPEAYADDITGDFGYGGDYDDDI